MYKNPFLFFNYIIFIPRIGAEARRVNYLNGRRQHYVNVKVSFRIYFTGCLNNAKCMCTKINKYRHASTHARTHTHTIIKPNVNFFLYTKPGRASWSLSWYCTRIWCTRYQIPWLRRWIPRRVSFFYNTISSLLYLSLQRPQNE